MRMTKREQEFRDKYIAEKEAERAKAIENVANQLLKFGIPLYDSEGNVRELYAILNDIAEAWEKAEKSNNEVENGD